MQAIYFDIGTVLLNNGYDRNERRRVYEHFSLTAEEIAAIEERHPAANLLWESGHCPATTYLERAIFFVPRKFTPDEFLAQMKAQSFVFEKTAIPVVEALAAQGRYRLATLNNESLELNDYRMDKFNLRQYFSACFCSGYVGCMKPDPLIYTMALRVLQVAPQDAVFIDDKRENCDSARAVGMAAVQYESAQQLVNELGKLGVEVSL